MGNEAVPEVPQERRTRSLGVQRKAEGVRLESLDDSIETKKLQSLVNEFPSCFSQASEHGIQAIEKGKESIDNGQQTNPDTL